MTIDISKIKPGDTVTIYRTAHSGHGGRYFVDKVERSSYRGRLVTKRRRWILAHDVHRIVSHTPNCDHVFAVHGVCQDCGLKWADVLQQQRLKPLPAPHKPEHWSENPGHGWAEGDRLEPGVSLARNGARDPESVLTPDQVVKLRPSLSNLFDAAVRQEAIRTREKQLRDLRRELTAQRSVNEDRSARIADLEEELAKTKRAAVTLGSVVDRKVTDLLRWAGMEDQIGTEDPDQQLAWERVSEMPARIADLEGQLRRSVASANAWRNLATERLQSLREWRSAAITERLNRAPR